MTKPKAVIQLYGASVEDRSQLHRIDHLRETPAALRFLSLEPLLEDLGELDLRGISLVIDGGESGPGARPSHPDWFRRVRDKCRAAGVSYFHKQNGEWLHNEQGSADNLDAMLAGSRAGPHTDGAGGAVITLSASASAPPAACLTGWSTTERRR